MILTEVPKKGNLVKVANKTTKNIECTATVKRVFNIGNGLFFELENITDLEGDIKEVTAPDGKIVVSNLEIMEIISK